MAGKANDMNFIERNADMILGAVFSAPFYIALTAAWVRRLTRQIEDLEEVNAGLMEETSNCERGTAALLDFNDQLQQCRRAFARHGWDTGQLTGVLAEHCEVVGWAVAQKAGGLPAEAVPDLVQEPLEAERDGEAGNSGK